LASGVSLKTGTLRAAFVSALIAIGALWYVKSELAHASRLIPSLVRAAPIAVLNLMIVLVAVLELGLPSSGGYL